VLIPEVIGCFLCVPVYPKDVIEYFLKLLVPAMADYAVIELLDGGNRITNVARLHFNPDKQHTLDDFSLRYKPESNILNPTVRVIASGKIEYAEAVPENFSEIMGPTVAARQLIRELNPQSYLIAPLISHERPLGVVTLVYSDSKRKYDAASVLEMKTLVTLAACVLEHAKFRESAERSIKTRESILRLVSHEIKNHITSISLSARLLLQKNGQLPELNTVIEASAHMARLIEDLLDVTNIERQRLSMIPKDILVKELMKQIDPVLAQLVTAREQKLIYEESCLGQEVRCDTERVLQVFTNLVANASKFSPVKTTIILRTACLPNEVLFSVQDFGPGIAEEDLPKIFDYYWQADETSNLGLGIGLAIAKGIIESHGGRIWAESSKGRGSTFYFTLPIAAELSRRVA